MGLAIGLKKTTVLVKSNKISKNVEEGEAIVGDKFLTFESVIDDKGHVDREAFTKSLDGFKNIINTNENIESPDAVNLILPDELLHGAVMSFSELPVKPAEAREFIRVQSAKNAYVDFDMFHCDYVVCGNNKTNNVKVLSFLVDKVGQEFVEKSFFNEDVIVGSVEPASVAVLNFLLDEFFKEDNFVFAFKWDDALTIYIVDDGNISLYRVKNCPSDGDFDLTDEVSSTLVYYRQSKPDYSLEKSYFLGDNYGDSSGDDLTVVSLDEFNVGSIDELMAKIAYEGTK